jgi:hypothetical protein
MKRLMMLAAAGAALLISAAHAQSFRAYVSSAGNDANPCTVIAPCRLLPAALNAVANGGEIWMLDSANYNSGTVNITKSVSIMTVPGAVGSIVAVAGGAAITVQTPGIKVGLRNVVIANNALNPGSDGIDVGFAALSVEDSLFINLPGSGINALYGGTLVHVKNTTFRNIQVYAVVADDGPVVNLANCHLLSTAGVNVVSGNGTTSTVNVTDTEIDGAGSVNGVAAYTYAAGSVARAFVTRSSIRNTIAGIDSQTNGTGNALITVSYSTITGNSYGIHQVGVGSQVKSLGNNHIADNVNADVGTLTTTALR